MIFLFKKKEPYVDSIKEYQLIHDILVALQKSALSITSTGSIKDGYVPLYEFQIETASLHFGTLVGMINEPEKFVPKEGEILYLSKLSTKIAEVNIIKYGWKEVSFAIEALIYEEDIMKELEGNWLDLDNKIIKLTKKGFISLTTNKYLLKSQQQKNEKSIYESTINTNLLMKIFTFFVALSAVLTLLVQLPQACVKPNIPTTHTIDTTQLPKSL